MTRRTLDQVNRDLGPRVLEARAGGVGWDVLVYELGYSRTRLYMAAMAEIVRRADEKAIDPPPLRRADLEKCS